MSEAVRCDGWVVLVVDDQQDNLLVAQTTLEFFGAEVHTAYNGEEGIALLDTIRPTVILLDLRMPVLNGWETLKRLQARTDLRRVPIIAVTAHAMSGDRQRVFAAGFDDYISKPYDIELLPARLEAAITRKQESISHV
ncbi:MAG: response regulator [Anaerolinea sp.]|nr:response regulator [Anaerolinea sp.]